MGHPASTYRLQITPTFDLDAAREVLPYLRALGVDWVYLSPLLQSGEGSDHGYDVVDPTRVDAARGGPEALERFSSDAHELGLHVLVDIVPNHQGVQVPRENAWWWDVLRLGQDSPFEPVFDIDWEAADDRIVLPVVGDDDMPTGPGAPIGHVRVFPEEGELRYYDLALPLAPGSADDVIDAERDEDGAVTGHDAMRVHDRQHYRLIHWRQGDFRINYRRFFTVTGLAGVRVEDEHVFDLTHAEILRWVREGLVDGLRIDHPDGLRDPRGYLDRLAEKSGGVYTVVEKILEPEELLPSDWATAGTTGYDALAEIDRLFTDPDGRPHLDEIAAKRSNDDLDDWRSLIHYTKRQVTDGPLHSEVFRITRELVAAGVDHPNIVDAVSEVLSYFPVYRSYLPEGESHLELAARQARTNRPDLAEAIDHVFPALATPGHPAAERLQMTSGMVMAKAVEDRAFYRYTRLTSLNEVGGDPSRFSLRLSRFHELQQRRQAERPAGMTTLSTHDTKRGEDVRARIHALSEETELWAESLRELDEVAPISHGPLANLVWQAVVGAWPASRERLAEFAVKAAREAGDRTSWTMPNAGFEKELRRAVDAVFDEPVAASVVSNVVDALRDAGRSNALAAKLVQLTLPGVPDVYQGTELWTSSLVDPDNRRPVDFSSRIAALEAILQGARPPVDDTGAAKLLVTAAALLLRRGRPELFTSYEPVQASGSARSNVIAFDRGGAITVATRLPIGLERGGGWGDTMLHLPSGEWIDQITARQYRGGWPVAVGALLAEYPVALLARPS
ncbi:malto-oligosyltrehalose synthase [Pseudoclavibacter chungangensis]|uniref:Malto-oligosyltrehalose synthase n=1 Tax=Pseudoclavibacter chungangensis TaxID=587635 RepID=A0A7J5BRN8_9MICO|nr:malto-oligosyltrehalose synthase [Pseudoclavibacter chungangensis]KAB1656884.1 malto-oligosyltrehalose synthase [Pseudoclavibacter chungangensis]NYJ67351.1 (1->4)-alpha-D-glucan 1-alpha-D-glucosylmutase [Pseudoclavibacter chungangensis]